MVLVVVGDTTFGPVAEGVRRPDVRNNEADAKSKRGDGPSSWIFGSEDEDTRRPGDTSVVTRSNQWAPRSSSIRTKMGRLELWALLSCTAPML